MKLEQINQLKTLRSLERVMKQSAVDVSILDWSRLYHITIGSHESNIFITLDLSSSKPRLEAVERTFNGKNYDLHRQLTLNPTKLGIQSIRQYLNNEA